MTQPENHPQRPPRRHLNPHKPPYDQQPIINADADGNIHTTRGTFNTDDLTDAQRDLLRDPDNHGVDHVVFTNSLGQHRIIRAGDLIYRHVDLTRVGDLPPNEPADQASRFLGVKLRRDDENLAYHVAWYRIVAQYLTEAADTYEALLADGWELNPDPFGRQYGELIQTDLADTDSDEADLDADEPNP